MKKTMYAIYLALTVAVIFATTACAPGGGINNDTAGINSGGFDIKTQPNATGMSAEVIGETDLVKQPDAGELAAKLDKVESDNKIELKEYFGKTAVIVQDVKLKTPYFISYGFDEEDNPYDVVESVSFDVELKKGDIVIVIEGTDSLLRVSLPVIGDPPTIRGYVDAINVSFDANVILNANQCRFSDVPAYDDEGGEVDRVSGAGDILERLNGKFLVSLPGGRSPLWINETDASYDFNDILKDIQT
jgi:hypothetical protein